MSKEIRKNREGLIRYLILVNDKPKVSPIDCAKCRTLDFLGVDNPMGTISFAGDISSIPQIVSARLDMSEEQWHDMEKFFEGFGNPNKHSFAETAYKLQTLPGWPRVL